MRHPTTPEHATTPAHAAMEAIRTAIALHGEADRPMDLYRQQSHARRILLAALASLDPEYREALPGLQEFERSTDNSDCACALIDAAAEIHLVADEYEAHAEREDRLEDQHIAEETAAYRHSVGVYG